MEQKKPGEFDIALQDIITKLQIGKNKIELKGSASLKSQKYYSDYDLFTKIKALHPAILYENIVRILNYIDDNPDLYFIELKIQNKLGHKYKYYKGNKLEYDKFCNEIKNIDFIKIDFVMYANNRFIEVSIIYSFSDDKDEKYILKGLKDDIDEMREDKKYFKMLKRYFTLYKELGNKSKLAKINKVLNSKAGELYSLKSNLEALLLVSEYYKDELTKNRILLNLKELKMNPNISSITQNIDLLQKEINKDVEQYI